eukprot:m51a1_g10205 hypothetical protein (265) ;mRNA; f:66393-67360
MLSRAMLPVLALLLIFASAAARAEGCVDLEWRERGLFGQDLREFHWRTWYVSTCGKLKSPPLRCEGAAVCVVVLAGADPILAVRGPPQVSHKNDEVTETYTSGTCTAGFNPSATVTWVCASRASITSAGMGGALPCRATVTARSRAGCVGNTSSSHSAPDDGADDALPRAPPPPTRVPGLFAGLVALLVVVAVVASATVAVVGAVSFGYCAACGRRGKRRYVMTWQYAGDKYAAAAAAATTGPVRVPSSPASTSNNSGGSGGSV